MKMMNKTTTKERKLDDTRLRACPVCKGRCIRWKKNDLSFVVCCVKCRYHMGPYTRSDDAARAHNHSRKTRSKKS